MAAPANAKQDDVFFETLLVILLRTAPNLPLHILEDAIHHGITGFYSDGKNVSVTSISIFSWIKQAKELHDTEARELAAKIRMENYNQIHAK